MNKPGTHKHQRHNLPNLAAALAVVAGITFTQAAHATVTLNSVEVSGFASAYSNGTNLDQDTTGGPASGIQNWSVSAFSSGGGQSGSGSGSYQSNVTGSTFTFSTSGQNAQISSTSAANNGYASTALIVNFTVDVESQADFLLSAALSTPAGGSYGNLILRDDGVDVVSLFRGSGSGSVSQTFTLLPGSVYEFVAVYYSSISSGDGLGTSTSISSGSATMEIQSVPEPGALALAGLGLVPLLLRRRRNR